MGEKINFTTQELLDLAKTVSDECQFIELNTFNDEMTISQVVRFFNKQGKNFTKTMIQNYVRVGVLPPPLDRRYYTKNHLILLSLIDNLKAIYSLDEIKLVLAPILKNPETFDDDIIKVSNLYEDYILLHKNALRNWENYLPKTLEEVNQLLQKDRVSNEEKDVVSAFMLVLTLMAETIAIKKLIHLISEKYLTNVEE
ncbi:DUF1836 domain-containing protein [Defluviitalea saccharophila]|uniref:DUF1836 domain-containing protein n=1 Tax=Defluviitalea saccharophila TaxID=879970 RepID=A0ABZ2Y3Y4_9FIRM|nr:DUF1836 domain-containing protein [Candidatus Epulonipiscium sp.]